MGDSRAGLGSAPSSPDTSSASSSAVRSAPTSTTIATWPIVALWIAALAAGIYAASLRYRVAGAVERRRMQWIGWGLTVAPKACSS